MQIFFNYKYYNYKYYMICSWLNQRIWNGGYRGPIISYLWIFYCTEGWYDYFPHGPRVNCTRPNLRLVQAFSFHHYKIKTS